MCVAAKGTLSRLSFLNVDAIEIRLGEEEEGARDSLDFRRDEGRARTRAGGFRRGIDPGSIRLE
jgi:hypothetical protein